MSSEYVKLSDDKYIYDIFDLVIKKSTNMVNTFSFSFELKKGHTIDEIAVGNSCEIFSNNYSIFQGIIDKVERTGKIVKVYGRDLLSGLRDASCKPYDYKNNTVEEIIKGCPHSFGNSSFEEGTKGWVVGVGGDTYEILRPTSDVDVHLSKYPNTGEANYEDVDDSTPDDDSTYVYAENTGSEWVRDIYGFQDHSTGTGDIQRVWLRYRIRFQYYSS